MDHRIQTLKQTGNIAIWQYFQNAKNYPGWHFTGDQAGRDFLLALLELMVSSEWSSHKRLHTISPDKLTSVPNSDSQNDTWVAKENLLLRFIRNEDDLFCSINEVSDGVEISFGESKLREFQRSLRRVDGGENDFFMMDEKNSNQNTLWFW